MTDRQSKMSTKTEGGGGVALQTSRNQHN